MALQFIIPPLVGGPPLVLTWQLLGLSMTHAGLKPAPGVFAAVDERDIAPSLLIQLAHLPSPGSTVQLPHSGV
uniref:Putative secreted protein n=1 Tax=Panstrongylus lignarius TaxID=156445 RepID=A0A224Y4K5_9HEMI